MGLTPDEKKRIADFMGWPETLNGSFINKNGCRDSFDLNDAGLCVVEMTKRKCEGDFMCHAGNIWIASGELIDLSIWLFTTESDEATNFFRAFSEFIKQEEGNE